MRTGTRCTILIQLPVAFCAGSSANAEPVPAPKPDDLAVVVDLAAVEVGGQRHRLPDAHVGELRFLEVGIDPDLVERHDRHQRRARGDALPELHGALGDEARDRRRQLGARVGQVGLAHARGGV